MYNQQTLLLLRVCDYMSISDIKYSDVLLLQYA